MTRITQQRTRQAVLTVGERLDPLSVPEKLQLFNELGEPLMMGGGYSRHEQEDTTILLAQGEIESNTITFFPSVRFWKIATNRPARVRLYPTAAMRDADLPRAIGHRPRGNHGRLLEVVTTSDLLEVNLSPTVDVTSVEAFNGDFFASITNLDTLERAVVVTYSYFRTE